MTKLVVPTNRTNDELDHEDVCPVDGDISTETPINKGDYDWSEQMQGYILGSFYLGYLISQLPGGVLADKYGAKWALCACLLLSGLCTMCLPLAIYVADEWGLIVMRVITGLAQGPLFPALTALLSAWVPSHERGRLCAFAVSGVTIGTVVSNLSSGLILHYYHWSVTFLVFGLTGAVWFIIFPTGPTSVHEGLASPPVVGYLTPNATMNEWRVVFWLGFVIFIISAIYLRS